MQDEVLEEVPDLEVRLGKLPPAWGEQGSWVRGMWNGRPNSFFLAWVTIGHGYLHLGEMQSIRTQLGFKGL